MSKRQEYFDLYLQRLNEAHFEATEPWLRYLQEDVNLISFLSYMFDRARSILTSEQVKVIRDQVEQGVIDLEAIKHIFAQAKVRDEFEIYPGMLAQMKLTRTADNFQSFISELLALIFRTNPQTLRTDESTVTLSQVLEYENMDELIEGLVDMRVTQLAHQSFRDLAKFCKKRIGLDILESAEDMAIADETIEQCNLIAHNRGVINKTFISRQPSYADQLGKRLVLTVDEVVNQMLFLRASTADLDRRASEKFGLKRYGIPNEEARQTIPGGWV
jgi:hypothetical protein